MFHQDHGGKFASGNNRFEVGGEVFANLNSNYMGLFWLCDGDPPQRWAGYAGDLLLFPPTEGFGWPLYP